MNAAAPRYAIYYLPAADTPLYKLGTTWLGYDLERNVPVAPITGQLSAEFWERVTESPRRYRFHATLKPPFRLAPGRSIAELQIAAKQFAAAQRPISGPPLKLARLGKFSALILSAPFSELHALSDDCVRVFDPFRLPPDEQEVLKRSNGGLSARELNHVRTWGYPYVFEDWKFHMTLTSSLPDPDWDLVRPHLESLFQPLEDDALQVDSICLFAESEPNGAFHLLARYPFAI